MNGPASTGVTARQNGPYAELGAHRQGRAAERYPSTMPPQKPAAAATGSPAKKAKQDPDIGHDDSKERSSQIGGVTFVQTDMGATRRKVALVTGVAR